MSRLVARLEECRSFLEPVGEAHWPRRIGQAVPAHRSDEARLAQEVQGWFGGMGPFNDLLLTEVNGHRVSPLDERQKGERLRSPVAASHGEPGRWRADLSIGQGRPDAPCGASAPASSSGTQSGGPG